MSKRDAGRRGSGSGISVIFSGGGTGGHVLPGISVAQRTALRFEGSRILFVGTGRPAEKALVREYGFGHVPLDVIAPAASPSRAARFAAGMARSVVRASGIIAGFKPDAVVGLGGYASVPCALAALRRGVPLYLLEQNASPGKATTLLAPAARRIFCGFGAAARVFGSRGVACGNPLRADLSGHIAAMTVPGSSKSRMLLVMGGSQGARAVNRLMVGAAPALARIENLRIVHLAGNESGWVEQSYLTAGIRDAEVLPFDPDVGRFLRRADLVVSRAGAMAVSEICAFGRPAVFIPYPFAGGHQKMNTLELRARGAAEVLDEDGLLPSTLAETVTRLIGDVRALTRMHEAALEAASLDAADRILGALAGNAA